MKFLKCISLFFIYPTFMFCIGFCANMGIQEFFYPGETVSPSENDRSEDALETSFQRSPVLHADTKYVIMSYDVFSGEYKEIEEDTPSQYIGYTRDDLVSVIDAYTHNPSLEDKQNGFQSAEVILFSPQKVVIRKNYEKREEGFYLVCEDHKVNVYDKSLIHIYMKTGITMEELPYRIQREIMKMKYIATEEELFHFLESYSS